MHTARRVKIYKVLYMTRIQKVIGCCFHVESFDEERAKLQLTCLLLDRYIPWIVLAIPFLFSGRAISYHTR